MATCSNCGSTIVFGGARAGPLRFCNKRCLQRGMAHVVSLNVPNELIRKQVLAIHQGDCPKCGRPGPVDVHASHRVLSLGHAVHVKNRAQLSCRTCGVRSQIAATLFSLFFGWWGIGFLFMPFMVMQNLVHIFKGHDPNEPSPELEQHVRADVAQRAAVIQAEMASLWKKARSAQAEAEPAAARPPTA